MENLLKSSNYSPVVDYVFSNFIREYDIRKANISVLYSLGIISKDEYNFLFEADRMERQRTIGIMQLKDNTLAIKLADGIMDYKRKFFGTNGIKQKDVLSIKNDAVFLLNRVPSVTKFGEVVEFVCKNTYSSYIRLGQRNKVEIYYGFNKINGDEVIDTKGLGLSKAFHKDYMLDFIGYILNTVESESIESAISILLNFYRDYVDLKLDIGYYREFNSYSKFLFKNGYGVMALKNTPQNKQGLDIRYNIGILKDLYKHLSSEYFIRAK